ncbi:MAG TPA: hypothetical protein VFS23_02035 [Vicinamibacterales bacterium]|jgi:hypothetical protein|nr:hypothetical protein [Vicinamibacterales bacterium]
MNRSGRFLLILAGVTLAAAAASAEQAKPAVTPPAATAQKPNDEAAAAPKKLVAPVRGEALIGYTKPVTKQEKNMIITTIKIKNLSSGAIAGLKVDEFWYDKEGNPVTGSQPFRWRKPLQPGEVIDVVLQVPRNPNMNRNQYKFEHANGTIKTQLMPKL